MATLLGGKLSDPARGAVDLKRTDHTPAAAGAQGRSPRASHAEACRKPEHSGRGSQAEAIRARRKPEHSGRASQVEATRTRRKPERSGRASHAEAFRASQAEASACGRQRQPRRENSGRVRLSSSGRRRLYNWTRLWSCWRLVISTVRPGVKQASSGEPRFWNGRTTN